MNMYIVAKKLDNFMRDFDYYEYTDNEEFDSDMVETLEEFKDEVIEFLQSVINDECDDYFCDVANDLITYINCYY